MNDYFLLHYHMTNRTLRESGIHPVVGYVMAGGCFILLSEYLVYKTGFAKYLVILAALSLLISAAEIKRNEFLTVVFGSKKSRTIRIIENVFISLPFSILLLCHLAFAEAIVLITGSMLLAGVTFKGSLNYSLPTPFYKKPFEFTVGFRKTVYLLPIAYGITVIALSVDNFNLGIFTLLLIFLISLTFYVKPEMDYFIWSHSAKPSGFIFEKLKTATVYAGYLALPIVISLVLFYPENAATTLLFTLTGLAFLWTMILAKYAAYPHEMSLPEGIPMVFCICFPPILVAVMPFFYSKSVKNLNLLLK